MSVLAKLGKTLAATAVAAVVTTAAIAKPVTIRVQSVISAKADEVTMLKNFAADVKALTAGDEVTIEVLPAGAVVGVKETLDAVDKGLLCSVLRQLVVVSAWTTLLGCHGSSSVVVKSFTTNSGQKWA